MSTKKSTARRWEVPAADGFSRKWVGWSEDGFYFLETQEPNVPRWSLDSDPSDDDKPFRILGHLMTVTANEVDWDAVDPGTLLEVDNAPTLLWLEQSHDSPASQAAATRLRDARLLAS